jgi:hypothetical protein
MKREIVQMLVDAMVKYQFRQPHAGELPAEWRAP